MAQKSRVSKPRVTKTREEVLKILSHIKFANSCVNMGWDWEVTEIEQGFILRCSFRRPDVYKNDEIGIGFGRPWLFDKNSPQAAIVKTAWCAAKMIVEHEMMEAFEYKGAKIFNPHKSLTDLAYPVIMEHENYEH